MFEDLKCQFGFEPYKMDWVQKSAYNTGKVSFIEAISFNQWSQIQALRYFKDTPLKYILRFTDSYHNWRMNHKCKVTDMFGEIIDWKSKYTYEECQGNSRVMAQELGVSDDNLLWFGSIYPVLALEILKENNPEKPVDELVPYIKDFGSYHLLSQKAMTKVMALDAGAEVECASNYDCALQYLEADHNL